MSSARLIVWAVAGFAVWAGLTAAARAELDQPAGPLFTAPLSIERDVVRPSVADLPLPRGFTREQIALGDRIFHGEAAGGRCSHCHAADAKGSPTGNDLTTGMYIWADGTVNGIKRVVMHNMSVAPGMDGDLTPADVEAVAGYIWALGRRSR